MDGWTATTFIDDLEPLAGEPETILAHVSDIGGALGAVTTSDVGPVMERTDRWARADRVAWGEATEDLALEATELVAEIRDRLTGATPADPQLIHADLAGNTCRDRAGGIVVLDFSPVVRPVAYMTAIVVADNLLWNEAPIDLAHRADPDALARALIFRLVAEQLAVAPRHGARLDDYRRVLRDWPRG